MIKISNDCKRSKNRYLNFIHSAIFFSILLGTQTFASAANTFPFSFPKVQMHRGYWADGTQENTLAAFAEANRHQAKMIELDVQFSKDKQVIVFHDDDLKRLPGIDAKVNSMTAAELKKTANIPTLEEVLSDPQIPLLVNIEIKQWTPENQGLELATISVVEHTNAIQRVIFSSFNEHSLSRCAFYKKEIPRALLTYREDDETDDSFIQRLQGQLSIAQTELIHMNYSGLSLSLNGKLKSLGYFVNVWTVNEETEAVAALKMGVLSVITDNIKLIPLLDIINKE